jgi:hypothetical protein
MTFFGHKLNCSSKYISLPQMVKELQPSKTVLRKWFATRGLFLPEDVQLTELELSAHIPNGHDYDLMVSLMEIESFLAKYPELDPANPAEMAQKLNESMILTITEIETGVYRVMGEGGGTDSDGGNSYTRQWLTEPGTFYEAYAFTRSYAGDDSTEVRLDRPLDTI